MTNLVNQDVYNKKTSVFATLPKTAELHRSHFLSKGPTCSRENLVEVFPGNLDTLSIVNDIKLQDFLHIHEIICTSVGIFFVDVSISFESTSGEFGVCSTSLIQLRENNGPISPSEGEPGTKAGILF